MTYFKAADIIGNVINKLVATDENNAEVKTAGERRSCKVLCRSSGQFVYRCACILGMRYNLTAFFSAFYGGNQTATIFSVR